MAIISHNKINVLYIHYPISQLSLHIASDHTVSKTKNGFVALKKKLIDIFPEFVYNNKSKML